VRALVEQICAGLGIAADATKIEESTQENDVTVTVSMPLSGVQALDGREHRLAKAVRQVLSAAAAAQGKQFHLVARAND
jgi:predicted RNA-binding protein YlqC (UPF0109 family)